MSGFSAQLHVIDGRRPWWRHALLALSLFAFVLAGYATQTHIHPPAIATHLAGEKSGNRTPAPDDPQHCPLCQEYVLAGAYVLPPPIALPLPAVVGIAEFVLVSDRAILVRFPHGWQGRAPPRI